LERINGRGAGNGIVVDLSSPSLSDKTFGDGIDSREQIVIQNRELHTQGVMRFLPQSEKLRYTETPC